MDTNKVSNLFSSFGFVCKVCNCSKQFMLNLVIDK